MPRAMFDTKTRAMFGAQSTAQNASQHCSPNFLARTMNATTASANHLPAGLLAEGCAAAPVAGFPAAAAAGIATDFFAGASGIGVALGLVCCG